jgi:hypothetical protein
MSLLRAALKDLDSSGRKWSDRDLLKGSIPEEVRVSFEYPPTPAILVAGGVGEQSGQLSQVDPEPPDACIELGHTPESDFTQERPLPGACAIEAAVPRG